LKPGIATNRSPATTRRESKAMPVMMAAGSPSSRRVSGTASRRAAMVGRFDLRA
jgi:hypothetical protein